MEPTDSIMIGLVSGVVGGLILRFAQIISHKWNSEGYWYIEARISLALTFLLLWFMT